MKLRLLLLLAVCLGIRAYASTTVITSTYDPSSHTYVLATNTIPDGGYTFAGSVTNFTGVQLNAGIYTIVYTTAWNPATYRSELITNYVKVRLMTNVTVTTYGLNSNTIAAPVLTNFTVSLPQNVPVTIDYLSHVLATNGYTAFLYFASATNGTVLNNRSNVFYLPATNYVGSDLIRVSISDLTGLTNAGTINLLITNRPPLRTAVALPVINMYRNDLLPYDLTACYRDPGNLPLSLTNIVFYAGTIRSNGLVMAVSTSVNWVGTSNIDYNVTDGYGKLFGSLTINVLNRPPVVPDRLLATLINTLLTIPALTYCSDPEGDPLTLKTVASSSGTATIVGTNIVFAPTTGMSGAAYVAYGVSDGYVTNTGMLTINVTGLIPVVTNTAYTQLKNSTLTVPALVPVYSPYGLPVSLFALYPTNCAATIAGTNILLTFNTSGTGYLGYSVTDGQSRYGQGVITVIATNVAVATNFTVNTGVNQSIYIDLLGHGSTPSHDRVSLCSIASVANGLMTDLSGPLSQFTPNHDFAGTASIQYVICLTDGTTATGTCTVNVTNRPPVVVSGTATGVHDTSFSYDTALHSYSPSGSALFVTNVSVTHGSAIVGGGTLVFTPTTGYLGVAVVSYSMVDAAGGIAPGTFTVTLTNSSPLIGINYGFDNTIDGAAVTNRPYLWQPNIPIPIPPDIAPQVTARLNNYPQPFQPQLKVVSPEGLPLKLVWAVGTNCTALIEPNGTNIDWALSGQEFGLPDIGYQVSDGVNTAVGRIRLRNIYPIDTVITNFINNLHADGSGSITLQGYNLSVGGQLMVQSLSGPFQNPNNVAVSGSCGATANGSTSSFGTINGPANATWPTAGCSFAITDGRVTTITLPAGDTGPLRLTYYGPNTGRAITITNNFVPAP